MARTKQREQTIFFPWEKTGSLFRRLGLGRARPLAGVAAIVLLFVVLGVRERERVGIRSTRATHAALSRGVDAYRADHEGKCPASLGELRGKYIDFEPVDAWGRPFRLLCPGFENPTAYDLISDGPDGVFGGLDRIP